MQTVHKFHLQNRTEIDLPRDAKPLTVQWQDGHATMWVQLDTDAPKITRVFAIYGTGHKMVEGFHHEYIATLQDGAGFVWHIFEVVKHART